MSLVSLAIQQDAKRHVCLISFKILIFCLARFMMYMTLPEARKLQAAPMCITKFINEKKSWCICACVQMVTEAIVALCSQLAHVLS